jgi:rod shape-determining protein MreD
MDKKKYFFNKWVAYGTILIVLYVINTTIIDWIKIFSIKPNLIVALVVCVAVFENYLTGGVFGLFAGYFCDVLSAKAIGPGTLCLMLCGFAIGYLCSVLLQKSMINALWLTIVTSFVYNTGLYLIFYASFNAYEIFLAFFRIIIPEAAYTAVFVLLLYFLIRKLNGILKETQ